MAYSSPYTFTALELLTAAKMNAIQTNITALWPYTTAGDTHYASGATSLTRLGIGNEYQFKQVNAAGNAPIWGGLHYASVYHSTSQNVSTGSSTVLAFNSELSDAQTWHDNSTNPSRITVSKAGDYLVSTSFFYTAAAGSGTYWDTVSLLVNGSAILDDRRLHQVDVYGKLFSVTFALCQLTAGQYFEIALEQNSGGTRAVQAGARFSVVRIG